MSKDAPSATLLHHSAQRIRAAYERHAMAIPLSRSGHFFLRAWRATNNHGYIPLIAWYAIAERIPQLQEMLALLQTSRYSYKRPPKRFQNPSQNRRHAFYEQQPEIRIYDQTLSVLFFLASTKLIPVVPAYNEAHRMLHKRRVLRHYLDPDVIAHDSSYAIESLFFLEYLGIARGVEKGLTIVRNSLFVSPHATNLRLRSMTDEEFQICLYTLTHIIIVASQYYQRRATNYHWVIAFFAQTYREIINRARTDVLAEVGLTFRLSGLEQRYATAYRALCAEVYHRVMPSFPSSSRILYKKEHVHLLTMLLFTQRLAYVKGPNLRFDPLIHTFFITRNKRTTV